MPFRNHARSDGTAVSAIFSGSGGRIELHRGRDVAGAIKATHPHFGYQPIAEAEELGNGGRIQWVSGPLDVETSAEAQ